MGHDETDDPEADADTGAGDDIGAPGDQAFADGDPGWEDGHALDELAPEVVESANEPPHPAAGAANWRTVLAADALIGLVALVAGVVAAFTWIPLVGAGLAAFGLGYLALVARRGARWATWRRSMGW